MIYGWGSIAEAKARGYEAAKLAVELGKDDPIALSLGGFGIAFLGGRLEEGLAHIERALTLNPNSLVAWRYGGTASWMIGQHEKSIQYYERAMQLSPLDTGAFESYLGISFPYFFLGRYDQALHWVERALREKPRLVPALMLKIAALAMDGSHPDELRDTVQQVKSIVSRCVDRSDPCRVWSFPDPPIASSSKRRCARRDFQNKRGRKSFIVTRSHPERRGPRRLPRRHPRRGKRVRRRRHRQGDRAAAVAEL